MSKLEMITSLNTLCRNCGYFDDTTPLNNGYGCRHKDNSDGEFLNSDGEFIGRIDDIIAISLTGRNIKCNRRLAKKYIKKSRAMSLDEKTKRLNKLGINFYGKCYSFSCPISYEVSFESVGRYQNGKDFGYIESEDEMPRLFGDELMAVDLNFYEN